MGMNEVELAMNHFEASLELFNDSVSATIKEIEAEHELLSPMWRDSMRDKYDEVWAPLEERLEEYEQRVGPQYVSIMLERLQHLRSYLYGD